jgi:hypothetical protein
MTVHDHRITMPQTVRAPRHRLEARILPRQAGLYPVLKKESWYRVRPDGPTDDGECWLVGYGVKERVSVVDFEFRKAR